MSEPVSRFEPQSLAAGDTVSFRKTLPRYLATDGWALTYEMRGGGSPVEFTSVADGTDHLVTVAAAVTASWVPGEYALVGYAIKAATGERFGIYENACTVSPNLVGSQADQPVKTFYQQMLENTQAELLRLSKHSVIESDIEGTRILREKRKDLANEQARWLQLRQNEIEGQRAADGLPSKNKIHPSFRVTPVGPPYGQQWPFGNEVTQ